MVSHVSGNGLWPRRLTVTLPIGTGGLSALEMSLVPRHRRGRRLAVIPLFALKTVFTTLLACHVPGAGTLSRLLPSTIDEETDPLVLAQRSVATDLIISGGMLRALRVVEVRDQEPDRSAE